MNVLSDALILLVIAVVGGYAYFLPWVVALSRKHTNVVATFVLNLFVGGTLS